MQQLNTELILIRITGEDRPGLTASVTEILAKYDATILDYYCPLNLFLSPYLRKSLLDKPPFGLFQRLSAKNWALYLILEL